MPTEFDDRLNEVKQKCLNCEKCSLCHSKTNTVFSAGVPNSKIMLIGEAPGYYEDQQGEPFVGKAGKLLDQILGCVGFSRKENIYICNTLKCRPPENRVPTNEEKALCEKYLLEQIKIVNPKVIVLCGATSAKSFLGDKIKISQIFQYTFLAMRLHYRLRRLLFALRNKLNAHYFLGRHHNKTPTYTCRQLRRMLRRQIHE